MKKIIDFRFFLFSYGGGTPSMIRHFCTNTSPFPYLYLTLLERSSNINELRPLHAHMIILGLVRYTFITSRVLAFCASDRGDSNYAQQVFDQIPTPTLFNWNTMIRCYSNSPQPELGLLIYKQMRRRCVNPNMHTFPITAKACRGLSSLFQVHAQVFRFGFDADVFAVSALIRMYSSFGDVGFAESVFEQSTNRNVVCWTSLLTGYCDSGMLMKAKELFDEMPERNDSSWSAMITGYVKNEQYEEAIELFRCMTAASRCSSIAEPNGSLLVSVLNACASLGASETGRWVHSYLQRKGIDHYGAEIGTALVDFYAKTGCLDEAKEVFEKIRRKDTMAWSAMIIALAINGHSQSAIDTFSEMLACGGVKPNAITFIGVLTACSHGGMVDEGWKLFKSMEPIHGIRPTIEHYGCMVDLLARAGHITEAEEFIQSLPIEPDAVIWGALLNGCLMHDDHKDVGVRIGRILIELDPKHAGRYVGLANVYAASGHWEGVMKVRKMMKDRGVALAPGWSSLAMEDGSVHRFQVGDKSHRNLVEIYDMLKRIHDTWESGIDVRSKSDNM